MGQASYLLARIYSDASERKTDGMRGWAEVNVVELRIAFICSSPLISFLSIDDQAN
jgi:hypothetical protein